MEVTKLIKDVYRVDKVSTKGNSYQVLVIEFSNGYLFETFISNEQKFILNDVPLR